VSFLLVFFFIYLMFFSYNIYIFIFNSLTYHQPSVKNAKNYYQHFVHKKIQTSYFLRDLLHTKRCVWLLLVYNFFFPKVLYIKRWKNYKTTNLIESQSILELNLSGILERCQKTPLWMVWVHKWGIQTHFFCI